MLLTDTVNDKGTLTQVISLGMLGYELDTSLRSGCDATGQVMLLMLGFAMFIVGFQLLVCINYLFMTIENIILISAFY